VSDERVRLFVALELPDEVRAALVEWRERVLKMVGDLRPVASESLHVTLCFLGWQDEADVPAVAAACSSIARAPTADLALRAGIWLAPRRPHVLAVELRDDAGRLGAVQSELSTRLAGEGLFAPERRAFLPHVTVARVKHGARVRPRELPPVAQMEFIGSRVTLFRTRLGRSGARYEALRTVSLGEPQQ
jgi:RNA 2',3'-cyclic 3'-phosphodiesterase